MPEGGVQSGDVWGPLVGKKLEEKAGALARSHRAEVQRALAAYRASEAVEREAATEAGEQTPVEAAGAQDAHLSAEGPGASSGEAAGACSEEADRADEQRGGQEASKGARKCGGRRGTRLSAECTCGPSPRKGHRQKAALLLPGRCHPTRVRALPTRSPPARWWWAVPPFPTAMCAAARRRVPEAAFGWGRMRWTTAAGAISSGTIPGSFAPVCSLSSGDAVVVCDRSGAQRAYTVREVFQVEETATWKTIASRVTGYGESVVLQTCAGDGMNVIVVAA